MDLRAYQREAIKAVLQLLAHGALSVCLVSPTGSGKTVMGVELCDRKRALVLAHRRELVVQWVERLRQRYGSDAVGVLMPGYPHEPHKRIQVGTVQTVMFSKLPNVELLLLDEAHHYVLTNSWGQKTRLYDAEDADDFVAIDDVFARFPQTQRIGLTATPQRYDGTPLGDMFGHRHVAAQHSELLRLGHIVPWSLFSPPEETGNEFAISPVDAYRNLGDAGRAFAYFERISVAAEWERQFDREGIKVRTISAETPRRVRDEALSAFRHGDVRVITNVFTMTEGVDVPEVAVIILGRRFVHISGYLQACGRAARAADGKRRAILIDLFGSSLRHGNPSADIQYSLDGTGMRPKEQDDKKKSQKREYLAPDVGQHGLQFLYGLSNAAPPKNVPEQFLRPLDTKLAKRLRQRAARRGGPTVARLSDDLNGGLTQ